MVNAFTANTLMEALEIRKEHNAIPFAGGTDLMVKRKGWAGTLPSFNAPVVFIGGLAELKGCRMEDGVLHIGAAEKLSDIAANQAVPEVLRRAVSEMASPAVRNLGTLGGNICNASPAGDTLPPLYSLSASVTLQSASGSRDLPIADFIKGPGKTDLREDELLTAVYIPVKDYYKSVYRKVGTRKADALSKVSFAALAGVRNGMVESIRIALGAVAPTVVRSAEAEALFAGRTVLEIPAYMPQALNIYSQVIRPIDDQRSGASYRKEVSLRLIEDFISGLAE